MPARVRAIGTQIPQLCQIEHLGQNPKRAVGLIGRVAHIVMERRDIAPLNIGHPVPADPGIDEEFD